MPIKPISESLSTFNTSLGEVKTDSAANLVTLQGVIQDLIDDEVITDEFDAVLTDLVAQDTALQALTVPALPNGVQYINTVLD